MLGVATPFGGEIVMHDFHRYLHPDIMISEMQVPMEGLTPKSLLDMSERAIELMGQYPQRHSHLDFALFSCTSGSQAGGNGYDAYLCKALKESSGAREACTTTTAVLRALKALDSKKLTLVTPYPDDVNAIEKAYFEAEGYTIDRLAAIRTPDPKNPTFIGQLDPEFIYKFAIEHMDPKSDTLFLSCTGLIVFEIIDELERRLGVPVVSSNQCAAWVVGKFFGYHGPHSYRTGMLFSK
jgi:maleate isomerase